MRTGEEYWIVEVHKFDINGLTFMRDDDFLLTGSLDRTIKYSDMKIRERSSHDLSARYVTADF